MAISKQQKDEILAEYGDWLRRSQAVFVSEYKGITMKQLDELRAKVRDAGGEFHVVKNTLGKVAVKATGMALPEGLWEGSTAVCFAFTDAAGMAKIMTEYARTSEFVKIKGGYLGASAMTAENVKALADLPPLPVMRSQLLGVLSAPAGKLVRTLAEPGRAIAAVIKAFADKDTVPAAA